MKYYILFIYILVLIFTVILLLFFNSIDKNLRSVVYCNALRSGNVTQWEFVWNKFVNETGPTEKLVLMSALGCTSDQQNIRS